MANQNEFIEVLSPGALVELQKLNAELLKTIEHVGKVNAITGKATPSGNNSAITELNTKLAEQESLIRKLEATTKKATATAKQMEAQSLKESNARNALNKQRERELALLERSSNMYNKIQAKMNLLSNEYKNLAARQQLGISLTDKEIQRYTFLQSKIQKYDTTLKAVDATMGKHQRNVGNYAGGIFGISNSINQLTREMPAFTYSVQTGFMALSNNIPIFTDAIGNAVRANKELQAQGKPTTSVLKQVAGALLSWQTLMGVGITLLTVYGEEIGDWITGAKKKTAVLEKEKKIREEQIQIEKQYSDTLNKLASDEQARAKIYLENAKNTSLPLKERIKNIDELQKRYPDYFASLSKEEILAGNTADAEYELNDALMKRALFLAVQDRIKDVTKELVDAEFKYMETQKKRIDVDNLYDENLDKREKKQGKLRLANEKDFNTTKNLKRIEEERIESLKKGNAVTLSASDILRQNVIKSRDKLDVLYKILNTNAKYNSVINEETQKHKKNTEEKDAAVKKAKDLNTEYEDFLNTVKELQEVQDKINENKNAPNETDITQMLANFALIDKQIEAQERLKKQTEEFVDSFKDSFIGDAGLTSVFKIVDGGLDDFGDNWQAKTELIMEATQEMYNFINKMSQDNFKAEYERLEKQKAIALEFTGDSEAAKIRIEEQYEARRKQIAQREAKAKKQQAIFNIAIDTAQAIVASFKEGFVAGLPQAIAMAAVGAAQIAFVSSKEIPEYWKGTDNAEGGLAWTQEKGAEIITDKRGNVKTLGSNKGAQLTKLDKGDKVFTAEKTKEMILNNLLTNNGIHTVKEKNNSLTASQMDLVLSKNLKDRPTVNTIFDKNGFSTYINKNGNITRELNNRANGKGLTF